jgi:adenylosuccinate synthase
MERVRSAGVDISPGRLFIDREAHLVLEYHSVVDKERERMRGGLKIGTTGRGIGPAYEDRYQRSGIRCADLLNLPALKEAVRFHTAEKNKILKFVLESDQQVDFETVWERLEQEAAILGPFLCNGSRLLEEALKQGERVVFEGAQGVLLDPIHGTYPYVTSSSTVAASALTGCGLGPKVIDGVVGVAKAYATRVGEGPFPTEMEGSLGDEVRARGHEFGTITGRPRRCGWFDAVAMRRAIRTSGLDAIVLTKLDVLSGLDSVKVCTEYRREGEVLDDLPSLAADFEGLVPHYIEFPGWSESISEARSWDDLPTNAQKLVEGIAQLVDCPICVVSVGPGREATMVLDLPPLMRDFIAA